MKPRSYVTLGLGIMLFLFGAVAIAGGAWPGVVPLLFGGSLTFLGLRGGRLALAIFGHTCIVVGCFLFAWGVYLIPHSQPTLVGVLARPLFWGMFSLLGGVCANYHAFCNCIRRRDAEPGCPGR